MVDSGAAGPLTEISAGASSAIRSAIQTLTPYANEDRVAALLNAIRDPEGDSEELAKALVETEAIAKSENVSVGVRDRAFRASMELQRSYLAKHSGGASVWDRSSTVDRSTRSEKRQVCRANAEGVLRGVVTVQVPVQRR